MHPLCVLRAVPVLTPCFWKSHHRGRLRDAIKELIDSRYFKLGLKLHEIKNAILIFPSVVLEVGWLLACLLACLSNKSSITLTNGCLVVGWLVCVCVLWSFVLRHTDILSLVPESDVVLSLSLVPIVVWTANSRREMALLCGVCT